MVSERCPRVALIHDARVAFVRNAAKLLVKTADRIAAGLRNFGDFHVIETHGVQGRDTCFDETVAAFDAAVLRDLKDAGYFEHQILFTTIHVLRGSIQAQLILRVGCVSKKENVTLDSFLLKLSDVSAYGSKSGLLLRKGLLLILATEKWTMRKTPRRPGGKFVKYIKRAANADEVKELRREAKDLKDVVAE